MNLEQIEIFTHQHYHISSALLHRVKCAVETASSVERQVEAEEGYRKLLQLHQQVEEQYKQFWHDPFSETSEESFSLPIRPPVER